MKTAIVLKVGFRDPAWLKRKEIKFPQNSYQELQEWEPLSAACPLPGLAIHLSKETSNIPFSYLKITKMRYEPDSGIPFFSFDVVQTASTSGNAILGKLPYGFVSTIQCDELLRILIETGESVPDEWVKLADLDGLAAFAKSAIETNWRDFVGNHFLALEDDKRGFEEFEDRVADLLMALGFKVISKGHHIRGAYADGIALFDKGVGIIYDCKSTKNFVATQDDMRALSEYVRDETEGCELKTTYGAYISRSSKTDMQKDVVSLDIEPLLYLLFVKLRKGEEFTLGPLQKILRKNMRFTIETINNEWLMNRA
jgi:hypothetical protein